jgi:hypothetical protein
MVRAAVEAKAVAPQHERIVSCGLRRRHAVVDRAGVQAAAVALITGDALTAALALTVYAVLPFNYFNGPFFRTTPRRPSSS